MNLQLVYPEARTGEKTLSFTDVVLTIIKPFQKTAHVETIDPTCLDLPSADSYIPLFLAYRLEDKSDAAYLELLRRMKESLQKVLVPFFSFGGRWIASPPGSGVRKLLCNDEGVPFIEAYLDRDLDTVVDASTAFQPVPELQGYSVLGMDMTLYQQKMQPDGLPCIFVQVTRFKCGGMVLAICFNHMHTDAKGFFNFMIAWSDVARESRTAIQVDHNRALVDLPASAKNFLFNIMSRPTTAAHAVDSHDAAAKIGLWALKTFEVKASTIKAKKQEAQENKYGFVSTGDCIIAYVWKALERLPSSLLGGKELAISMAVEGRSRFFDAPLPNLCGNVVTSMITPRISPSELQEMSVASVASKLREKLSNTAREDWLGLERVSEAVEALFSGRKATAVATSWFRFPMYDIDFGFGKPYFTPGENAIWSLDGLGTVYIGPPIPGTSASIATLSICSSPAILEALQCDPEFLRLLFSEGNSHGSSAF